ncbi:DUF2207 domain-containing protein [Henriciella litoralis]|uniref:DUF2207 domain-containing protein n=1 Tax=Henriciella litoralis TaxID=568102 RepID=UPI000A034242|nr:DUF2207 domain-containing protein [Henriciella litoralis]
MARLLGCLFVALWLSLSAAAQEEIISYDVAIDVETSGDIIVKETIDLRAEHNAINRGIFRDLPRYFENDGDKLRYDYKVIDVQRDGREEPYETTTEGNAWRIRIGDPDVRIPIGPHTYQIIYRVKNQIRYFDDYDELYWNVTGSYWQFPIQRARARITFPDGARMVQEKAYTGAQGASGSSYDFSRAGNAYVFETTSPLGPREGLTVAVAVEKGVIDPPSASDKRSLWLQRHGALAVLLASLVGVFAFLYRSWNKVGRDPPKGPVFARYEAPRGYSPAAVHHIYHRGFHDHDALIATLVNLGIKGLIDIDARDKKETLLTPKEGHVSKLPAEEATLEQRLFFTGPVTLGDKYNPSFTSAYQTFRKKVSDKFGRDYFRWNIGYTLVAIVMSAIAIVIAIKLAASWSIWLTALVIAMALLNGLFMYLMPAPTAMGEKVRTEIEGFKLYLEKAEKLQLNAAEVGTDRPPPMTTERYEKFLPYAIALGVEKPWTKHFETVLPTEAAAYNPGWSHYAYGQSSLHRLNSTITSNITSAVSSSMPQSSSSSGSGGGGFSGGGGGGGGGGGW